jgi:hypothetical protein
MVGSTVVVVLQLVAGSTVVLLQLVCVSTELASSSSNIYLNLITKEESQYTVELTSQGFRVSISIQWFSKIKSRQRSGLHHVCTRRYNVVKESYFYRWTICFFVV